MELEKEIVQSKFKNERHKAVINVMYTANWLGAIHASFLKPYKLTPQQFNILRILRGQHPNPASIRLLTERMLDKMSNASRLVEKLRQKELLERNVCEDDRRQVNVIISQAGLDLLKQIDTMLEKEEKVYMDQLTEEEAIILNKILDKFRG